MRQKDRKILELTFESSLQKKQNCPVKSTLQSQLSRATQQLRGGVFTNNFSCSAYNKWIPNNFITFKFFS